MATSPTIGCPVAVTPSQKSRGWQAIVLVAWIVTNIGAFLILFQLYKIARRTFIQRGESVGFAHAEQIIALQQRLHIFIEPTLQHWIIPHEWMIRILNYNYAFFMWTFYVCCVIAMIFAPARFRQLRRVFLLSMVIALPWYALYPLAPPRMMGHYGLVDTLAVYGPNYFSDKGMVTANQFAAMPSMHVGWTTLGGFMLAAAFPWYRIGRVLGVLLTAMICLTVMATANHYVLDILGGWLVIAVAFAVASRLPAEIRLPLPARAKQLETQEARSTRLRHHTAGG